MNQQVPGTESVAKVACCTPRGDAFARPAGLLIGLAFAARYLVTLDRTGFWLDEVSTLLVTLALNIHYSAAIPLGALLIWLLAWSQFAPARINK